MELEDAVEMILEEIDVRSRGGVGMAPPFFVDLVSVRGDEAKGWIVRNAACNSLGLLGFTREAAEAIARRMNELFPAEVR